MSLEADWNSHESIDFLSIHPDTTVPYSGYPVRLKKDQDTPGKWFDIPASRKVFEQDIFVEEILGPSSYFLDSSRERDWEDGRDPISSRLQVLGSRIFHLSMLVSRSGAIQTYQLTLNSHTDKETVEYVTALIRELPIDSDEEFHQITNPLKNSLFPITLFDPDLGLIFCFNQDPLFPLLGVSRGRDGLDRVILNSEFPQENTDGIWQNSKIGLCRLKQEDQSLFFEYKSWDSEVDLGSKKVFIPSMIYGLRVPNINLTFIEEQVCQYLDKKVSEEALLKIAHPYCRIGWKVEL